jgi:dipeptidase E
VKIILGGGGTAEQEAPVLALFADLVGRDAHVLYLPIAVEVTMTAAQDHKQWITNTLGIYGIHSIVMWTSLADHSPSDLDSFDSVFIGGGNTFQLLHQIRFHRFEDPLIEFAQQNKPIYGGSAGAIIFGKDINSSLYFDQNLVGLSNTSGLDLCGGACIWCHFSAEQTNQINSYILSTGHDVISLPETAGLYVNEDGILALGQGAVYHWSKSGKTSLPKFSNAGKT